MKKTLFITALFLSSVTLSAGEFDEKIIGGTKTAFGEWPSTVALLDVDEINRIEAGNARDANDQLIPVARANYQAQFCGASLVGSDWVLTAAHCLVDNKVVKSKDKIKTLVGAHDLIGGGFRRDIKKIIIHADYVKHNDGTSDNDIALLQLESKVNVQTIGVASADPANGALAIAVGWGDLDGTSQYYPSELYEVELPIIDRSTCQSFFPSSAFTNNMLCAGYRNGARRDVCNGDSGGPLMARVGGGGYQQVGIISWGASCSDVGSFGAYTRLSKYKSWINSKTSPSDDDSSGGSVYFLLLPFFFLIVIRGLFRKNIRIKQS